MGNQIQVLCTVVQYKEECLVEKENIELIFQIPDGILLIKTAQFQVIATACIMDIIQCIVGICKEIKSFHV